MEDGQAGPVMVMVGSMVVYGNVPLQVERCCKGLSPWYGRGRCGQQQLRKGPLQAGPQGTQA